MTEPRFCHTCRWNSQSGNGSFCNHPEVEFTPVFHAAGDNSRCGWQHRWWEIKPVPPAAWKYQERL